MRNTSKLGSLRPLVWAGLFMLVGILILIYIGRDTARLMNSPLDEIDLQALLSTESAPTIESLRGKIVVLHFWGPWSSPCRKQFPEYVEAYRQFESEAKLRFICVSCSPGMENDLEKLKTDTSDFFRSLDVTLPTYSDSAMFTRGRIARMLASGGFEYPFTLVVDSTGVVREYWLGDHPETMKQLKATIDELLGEQSKANGR